MDSDRIWAHTDAARRDLAERLSTLTPEQWQTPSLCRHWSVRDVTVHLSQAHASFRDVLVPLIRARFDFDRLVFSMARAVSSVFQWCSLSGPRTHSAGTIRASAPASADPAVSATEVSS